MRFQLAEVGRPLISVARLVDAGNRVVFGPTGGFIAHVATGRKVQLVRDGNVYTLDMHLTPEPEEEGREGKGRDGAEEEQEEQAAAAARSENSSEGPGFTRQER